MRKIIKRAAVVWKVPFSRGTCNLLQREERKLLHIKTLSKFKNEGHCLVWSALKVNLSKLKSLSFTSDLELTACDPWNRCCLCHWSRQHKPRFSSKALQALSLWKRQIAMLAGFQRWFACQQMLWIRIKETEGYSMYYFILLFSLIGNNLTENKFYFNWVQR